MAKSKKPKKKYVPKPVTLDTMHWVKQGMMPASVAESTMTRVKIANYGALSSIKLGTGVGQDVVTLTHAFITAESIALQGIGKEYQEELKEARKSLLSIAKRTVKWGKIEATPTELETLILGLEVHDAQLETCTVAELEKAITLAKNAIRYSHDQKEKK